MGRVAIGGASVSNAIAYSSGDRSSGAMAYQLRRVLPCQEQGPAADRQPSGISQLREVNFVGLPVWNAANHSEIVQSAQQPGYALPGGSQRLPNFVLKATYVVF